jgi:Ni,Fe-hydrogenase III large subunit
MTAVREVWADALVWRDEVARRCAHGDRFAGLFATARPDGTRLTAALASTGRLDLLDVDLPVGAVGYPSLTARVPAAFWYEREIADLFGVRADGHPRLDPLILPLDDGSPRPRPGEPGGPAALTPHERPVPAHLVGPGLFTLPHGPVRSAGLESVEYLVETPGEDIPHLRIRPHAKHRGVEKRFEGVEPRAGVVVAERVEGIASVAHAVGYATAVERLCGVEIPPAAGLVRLAHAELERIANHLDVAIRLSDAAALAVATARFGWHKEQVMRVRSAWCGSRFGRGVVVPGGVTAAAADPRGLLESIGRIERAIGGDARTLMATASFLDRLRRTGPIPADLARRHGALGPIGRASGAGEDVRASRPYDGYRFVPVQVAAASGADTRARLQVRWAEVTESFRIIRRALTALGEFGTHPLPGELRTPIEHVPDGRAAGWAEAPQGEVLYLVEVTGGRLRRVIQRSASFHNLPLFHAAFAGDIFTDFPFIEAGFGLSIAGVAQ